MSPREPRRSPGEPEWTPGPKPAAIAAIPAVRQTPLDVREDLRQGREPFGRIMGALNALGADWVLVLRAPFEPVPLYRVLARRGFASWTERRADDDWSVWIYRELTTPVASETPTRPHPVRPASVRLDVRGLEPPTPLVRVLDRLDTLAPGEVLEVLHDRRPLFLYPQLDDRGFAHETDEPEPGLVRIRIHRADPHT